MFSHSIGVSDQGFEQLPRMARRLMRKGSAFNGRLGHDGEVMRKEGRELLSTEHVYCYPCSWLLNTCSSEQRQKEEKTAEKATASQEEKASKK